MAKLRRSHFLFLGYPVRNWSLRVFLHRIWGREKVAYRSWAVEPEPEPVVIEAEPAVVAVEEDQETIRHDLVAEVEAESLAADEDELEDEDRALLGGKKKKDRR